MLIRLQKSACLDKSGSEEVGALTHEARVLIEQYGDTFEYLGIYEGQEALLLPTVNSSRTRWMPMFMMIAKRLITSPFIGLGT